MEWFFGGVYNVIFILRLASTCCLEQQAGCSILRVVVGASLSSVSNLNPKP